VTARGVERADLRRTVEGRLRDGGIDTADAEARWILEEVLGDGGADEPVSTRAEARVDELVARRLAGEPLQYVLGSWSFRGLDLMVDRRVLIPRPETEITAQVAIDEAERIGARRGRNDPWRGATTTYAVADLGTGSGALALALAAELPDAEVWAVDLSADALVVARANTAGSGAIGARVRVASGEWFDALPADLRGRLQLVVTNPPYVAEHEVAALPREVADHEPRAALVAGPAGTECIERILDDVGDWLAPGGAVVVELAPHQAEWALEHAAAVGLVDARIEHDLTGRARVLVARAPGAAG
jgi:release factor glutamine methyltransferase